MVNVREVERHYVATWGGPEEVFRWPAGPMGLLGPDFVVARFARKGNRVVYATCGMSAPDDGLPLELHIIAERGRDQSRDDQLVELLTTVAHFHRTEVRLDLGHTVNFGRPWLAGSPCDHGLVSRPYLDGPDLEWGSDHVWRCLWLIPITLSELRYKKANGVDALEELFEQREFDYADELRAPVV